MAHQIENMAYVGATPWHGLGSQLSSHQPLEVWQREAGMNWHIEESPVRFVSGNNAHLGSIHSFPEQKVLFRSDTKAPLNSLWGGADYSADRKSGESLEIVGGRLTTALSLQPGVLDEYLARKGEHGRDIGFWARALIFAPDSKQGQRFEYGVTRSVEELNAFSIRCQALLDESKDAGGAPRKIICFDESLKPMWVALCNSIEMEIKAGGRFEGLNDHASKLTENIARVAAVLHCFEHGCDGSIGQGSLDWAISICMQCSDDFARIFRVVPQELKDVQAIGCWLVSFRNQGRRYFKKNYILQYGPTGTRSKARLNAALAEMSRRGMLNFVVMGRTTYVDMFPNLIHDQAKFNFDAFLAPPC